MNRKHALEDLKLIQEIFDNHKVRLILVWGTCLGFVRDKNFIKWDDDIDLAVIDDIPLKTRIQIGKDLQKKGFFRQDIVWKNVVNKRWELSEDGYGGDEKSGIIVMQRRVKITIFFFEEVGEMLQCFPRRDMFPLIETPKRFFQKLDKIKHKGYEYYIPSPVREYLSHTYNEWKKPNRIEHGKTWVQGKTDEELFEYLRSAFGIKRKDS